MSPLFKAMVPLREWERLMVRRYLALKHKSCRCAEVGVRDGYNADRIIELCLPKRLFLVDIWDEQWRYDLVMQRFSRPDVTVLRGDSVRMAQTIEPHSLDWVYIDGDHSYDGCLRDLLAWSDCVRAGGSIAGDDYAFPAVRAAVREACRVNRGLRPVWRWRQFILKADGR